jgi:hypothetical protein
MDSTRLAYGFTDGAGRLTIRACGMDRQVCTLPCSIGIPLTGEPARGVPYQLRAPDDLLPGRISPHPLEQVVDFTRQAFAGDVAIDQSIVDRG